MYQGPSTKAVYKGRVPRAMYQWQSTKSHVPRAMYKAIYKGPYIMAIYQGPSSKSHVPRRQVNTHTTSRFPQPMMVSRIRGYAPGNRSRTRNTGITQRDLTMVVGANTADEKPVIMDGWMVRWMERGSDEWHVGKITGESEECIDVVVVFFC